MTEPVVNFILKVRITTSQLRELEQLADEHRKFLTATPLIALDSEMGGKFRCLSINLIGSDIDRSGCSAGHVHTVEVQFAGLRYNFTPTHNDSAADSKPQSITPGIDVLLTRVVDILFNT
jgi:hypothetical protein